MAWQVHLLPKEAPQDQGMYLPLGQTCINTWLATFYLTCANHSIGRKDCAIPVNDKSVSRLHAVLSVEFPKEHVYDLNTMPQPYLLDKSRFGTLVNNKRIKKDVNQELHDGDEIRFGVNQNRYRLSYQPITIFWNPSSFSLQEQDEIQTNAQRLGAHLSIKIIGSTLSLMKETCTVISSQLLLSLVEGLPLISPAWLYAAATRQTLALPLPEYTKFMPTFGGDVPKDLGPSLTNAARASDKMATLLASKTFVFLSEVQFRAMGEVVQATGGSVVESFEEEDDSFFCLHAPGSCVVDPASTLKGENLIDEGEKHQFNLQKAKTFQELGVSLISLQEIGLAIVHRNAEKYCNSPRPRSPSTSTSTLIGNSSSKDTSLTIILPDDDRLSIPLKQQARARARSLPETTFERKGKRKREAEEQGEAPELASPLPKEYNERREGAEEEPPTRLTSGSDREGGSTPGQETSVGTTPGAPMERLMVTANKNLLARPLTPQPQRTANFKRFRKNASPTDVGGRKAAVIRCVEDSGKETAEMEAWLKEAADAELVRAQDEHEAEDLWQAAVKSGGSAKRAPTTRSRISKATKAAPAKPAKPPASRKTPATRRKSNNL
jgi:hypothetical protein